MDDARWERYAAFGGIWFVVLNVIGALLPGAPPAPDDSSEKIVRYYADHAGRIEVATFLAGLGIIGLLWWLGSIWRVMSRAEGERPRMAAVAVVGLAIGGALALASFAVNSTLALEHDTLGGGAKLLYVLTLALLGASAFGIVAHIAAVTSLSYRRAIFPAWINVVGWIAALAFLVASISIASDASWLGVFGLIAFFVWALWILAISVRMLRGEPAAVPAT